METSVEVLPRESADGPFSSSDLALLSENRNLRRELIKQLAPSGKVPIDKADKSMLLNLINGMDAEIIARARVKVAAKTEEALTNITAMVGQALLQHKAVPVADISDEALELPSHVNVPEPVPGQMDIGVIGLTIADVQEK